MHCTVILNATPPTCPPGRILTAFWQAPPGEGVGFPPLTRTVRDAGSRVYMPSLDAVRSRQHAAGVHRPSEAARNVYSHVIIP